MVQKHIKDNRTRISLWNTGIPKTFVHIMKNTQMQERWGSRK